MNRIKIALLHLLPMAGNIEYNKGLIEKALNLAAIKQVDWVITPELCVSGLQFKSEIGTSWITQQPDIWMKKLCEQVKVLKINLFLGCPEKGENGCLFNTVFVIDRNGNIIGKQRKINTVSDGWSTTDGKIEPIKIGQINVGVMICADAYTKNVADQLYQKGSDIIVAPSSWGPGLHGPEGEWEQRSIDTGLPIIVCNRTGEDESVSFWNAESLVIKNGKRILTHKSKQSAILTFEFDLERMELHSTEFEIEYLL